MAAQEQVSMRMDDYYSGISDSGSDELDTGSSSGSGWSEEPRFRYFTRAGMVRVEEGEGEGAVVKETFMTGTAGFGKQAEVVAIHRSSGFMGQARAEAFRIFSAAVGNKNGGNANLKYAWFGGSRSEICEVMCHGFGRCEENRGGYGLGVYLSPATFLLDCVTNAAVDDDGLRHVLLCHVILGNIERVYPGSRQYLPSSMEFDSGVDNIWAPRKYIIWSAYMNTHILPVAVVSFKADVSEGAKIPRSPCMSLHNLVVVLANYMESSKMALIAKNYNDFRGQKITRHQMLTRLREIAGDELLKVVIKLFR